MPYGTGDYHRIAQQIVDEESAKENKIEETKQPLHAEDMEERELHDLNATSIRDQTIEEMKLEYDMDGAGDNWQQEINDRIVDKIGEQFFSMSGQEALVDNLEWHVSEEEIEQWDSSNEQQRMQMFEEMNY